MKEHTYTINLKWTGNTGKGTKEYTSYSRDHLIHAEGKNQEIQGSSDPNFRGDPNRYNPEELFLSSIVSCHMLWYLHLCSTHNIVVMDYKDEPLGIMSENKNGSGQFEHVTLRPTIKIESQQNREKAIQLHHEAHEMCFIARSCNFEIRVEPTIKDEDG